MSSDSVLVVDFGTTTTVAAVVHGGETFPVKEPSTGSDSWPTVVCGDGDVLLVGALAEQQRRATPDRYRSEFKRDLGASAPLVVGEREHSVTRLVTAVLSAVRAAAIDIIDAPLRRAVVTVPASYAPGDVRYREMLAAAEDADYGDVELLPEPVAAALAPLVGLPFAPGATVLVYDFGGGTFDAAVVQVTAAGQSVLAHAALDDCGGHDLDVLLYRTLLDGAPPQLADLLDGDTDDPTRRIGAVQVRMALADFARAAKHALTEREVIDDFFTPALTPLRLTRTAVEDAAKPLIDRTVSCCKALLEEAEVRIDDLDAVLLVGGVTRMPAIETAIRAAFDRPVRRVPDPGAAVLRGAAAHAAVTRVRSMPPTKPDATDVPLRWRFPDDRATFLSWLVKVGDVYTPGTALARIRLARGDVWDLCADAPGVLTRQHAREGDAVYADDWLATTSQEKGGTHLPAAVVTTIAGPENWSAFADGGRVLVRFTTDGALCTHDVSTGALHHRLPGIDIVARGHGDRWYVVREAATVLVYDAVNGVRGATLPPDATDYAITETMYAYARRRPMKNRRSDVCCSRLDHPGSATYEGYEQRDVSAGPFGVAFANGSMTGRQVLTGQSWASIATAEQDQWLRTGVFHDRKPLGAAGMACCSTADPTIGARRPERRTVCATASPGSRDATVSPPSIWMAHYSRPTPTTTTDN